MPPRHLIHRLAYLVALPTLTLGCGDPALELEVDQAGEPLTAGQYVPAMVLGLRHNLNQTGHHELMTTTPRFLAAPMEGGDLGAPVHRGYEWWMIPDRPYGDPLAVRPPPGVVVALRHSNNQWNQNITAFGRNPVNGPASFPGFVRQVGGDHGASSGHGYFWYESTGEGFTDWASVQNLPLGTIVGLKHTLNQAGKTLLWNGKRFDAGNPSGEEPQGFIRICGGDRGAPRGHGYCWFERFWSSPTPGAGLPDLRVHLGRSIFVGASGPGDGDGDGLDDNLENHLAEMTKPFLRFDSAERHRRPTEPLTIFRVFRHPEDPQRRLRIRWVFLFLNDGGYGPSSSGGCQGSNWHPGDNDTATWDLFTANGGATWELDRARLGVNIKGRSLTWPESSRMEVREMTHPVIYMSAGKHHEYFTRDTDNQDSFYSFPEFIGIPLGHCNDDVDGLGAQFYADLYALGRPANVGEPGRELMKDLGSFFPGETPWGQNHFIGPGAGTNHNALTMP